VKLLVFLFFFQEKRVWLEKKRVRNGLFGHFLERVVIRRFLRGNLGKKIKDEMYLFK
jgi:hypothetical protein